jgi:hypothetical protein
VNFRKIAVVVLTALAMLAVSTPAYSFIELRIQSGVDQSIPLKETYITRAFVCRGLQPFESGMNLEYCFDLTLSSQFDGHVYYQIFPTRRITDGPPIDINSSHPWSVSGPDVICLRLKLTMSMPCMMWTMEKFIQLKK